MNGISLIAILSGVILLVFLTNLGVKIIRQRALELGLIDEPNHRSSHTIPTPRGGGLAIVVVTVLAWVVVGFGYLHFSWREILGYAVPALFIAGISWIDDLRSLPNKIRFLSHLLAAGGAIFVFGYFRTIGFGVGWELNLGGWGILLTLFWIVGLTNIYNFMDGIDGIAGAQAMIVGFSWSVIGVIYQQPLLVLLALALTASSAGFLFHNWPPARIFMGDVGSAFLGFSFAVLPLLLPSDVAFKAGASVLLFAVLPLWIFIADASFTMIRRACKGENIFTAHRSHLYQRLVIAGFRHRNVTLWYTAFALLGGTIACGQAYFAFSNEKILICIGILVLLFTIFHQVILLCEKHKKNG